MAKDVPNIKRMRGACGGIVFLYKPVSFFLCTGYVLMFTQKQKSGTKAPTFSMNSERYESGLHAKWKICTDPNALNPD